VQHFLTKEARRGVSASTQKPPLSALVFFSKWVIGTPLEQIDPLRGATAGARERYPATRLRLAVVKIHAVATRAAPAAAERRESSQRGRSVGSGGSWALGSRVSRREVAHAPALFVIAVFSSAASFAT
jgi:hypothetical protein